MEKNINEIFVFLNAFTASQTVKLPNGRKIQISIENFEESLLMLGEECGCNNFHFLTANIEYGKGICEKLKKKCVTTYNNREINVRLN